MAPARRASAAAAPVPTGLGFLTRWRKPLVLLRGGAIRLPLDPASGRRISDGSNSSAEIKKLTRGVTIEVTNQGDITQV
ncbi:hypothetical protein ACP70R_018224 [Stipagrostis hirtigluma subsp. patula]